MAPSRRILLPTIGSFGDVHPMIALGLELQRRGHRVTVATTAIYREKILSTGLSFHSIRPNIDHEDSGLMRRIMDLKRGPEVIFRDLLLPAIRDTFEDLDNAAQHADFALAGEIVFAMPLVGEKRGLPWATAVLSPTSFFTPHDFSVIPPAPWTKHFRTAPLWLRKLVISIGYAATRRWSEPVAALRKELGLRPPQNPLFVDKHSPQLNLILYSKVFAGPHAGWPVNSVQTGFVFYDRFQHEDVLDPKLVSFLNSGEPPVIFTLGSAAVRNAGNFYGESVEAARMLNRRALLLTGPNKSPDDLPDGVAAFSYAPYSQVFPQAACVVHQGGVGTTAQVLRAGCPQLVVPYAFDQPDNAARVERMGVARTLARVRYSGGTAAEELASLLAKTTYAERASEVGKQVRSEDGLTVACNTIESFLKELPSQGASSR